MYTIYLKIVAVVFRCLLWNVEFSYAQIGVTVCTDSGTECAILPNAICDRFNTLTCVCSAAQKYYAKPDYSGCDYNCGALTNPTNGAVSTTGTLQTSIATYTCRAGYKLTGVSTRTCVLGSGWSDVAPTCVTGKVGDSCTTVTNLCVNLINAPCTGGICTCLVGYTQSNDNECTEINECGSSPCMNGGTCANEIAKFTCRCPTGFNGTRCETNPNDCLSAPCQNGGACADGLAAYTCTCLAGYAGATCATNINECSSTPCQNGAVCNDGVNGYTCTCAAGFTGMICETNINECNSAPCKNGATCNDAVNRYTCTCAIGFTGTHCDTDIDDCAANPCQNGGSCADGIAKYTCKCAAGYTGINCETNINECEYNACKNGATCEDKVAGYTCSCVVGYTGAYCETDINECTSQPCRNGGICVDAVNTFTCTCLRGFSGQFCQIDVNECTNHSCQNGAICVDAVNAYTCTCLRGFSGQFCQIDVNDCANHSCLNGANCLDGVDKYTCDCAPGFSGTLCQYTANACTSNPCRNGGTCNYPHGQYTCDCAPGYFGTTCTSGACPVLPDIPHGHVDMSSGRHVGAIATYSCNNNYALVGLSVRTCETNGMWKGAIPECVYVFSTGVMWVALGEFGLIICATIAFCIWKRNGKKCCLNKLNAKQSPNCTRLPAEPSTEISQSDTGKNNIRKSNAYERLDYGEALGPQEYVTMGHMGHVRTDVACGQVDIALSNI